MRGSGAIDFAVQAGFGSREDGVFTAPQGGFRLGVWVVLRRAGGCEDCNCVAGVEEEVEADCEEGRSFDGGC